MKPVILKTFTFSLLFFLACISMNVFAVTATFDGSVSTNWNTANNWTMSDASTPRVPLVTDDVVLPNGLSLIINTTAVCNSFTYGSGATTTSVTFSTSAQTLTITGALSMGAVLTGSGTRLHTITIAGAKVICGSLSFAENTGDEQSTITVSTGVLRVLGDITMNTATAAFNQIVYSGAGILVVGGNFNNNGTFTSSTTSRLIYNGTSAQNVRSGTYNRIQFSGTGIKSLTANISIAAGDTILIDIGATLNAATFVIAGTDATSVFDLRGALQTANVLGVTGAAAATLSSTGSPTISIGTNCIVEYTSLVAQAVTTSTAYQGLVFSGIGTKTISGAITVADSFRVNAGAVLDVGTQLITAPAGNSVKIFGTLRTSNTTGLNGASGTTFRNTNGATLTLGTTSVIDYYSTSAQAVTTRTDYQGLIITGASIKTLSGDISIFDSLRINSTATLNANTRLLTGASGSLFRILGTLQTSNTSGLEGSASATIVNTNSPTVTLGTASIIEYTATSAHNITVRDYYGLTITGAAIRTTTGDINILGNLVVNTGATFAYNAETIHLTGNFTGVGALTSTSGIFNISGDFSNSGTFTCGTGSVNYIKLGAQVVRGTTTYRDVTFSGSGSKTLGADVTVTGILTVNEGSTFDAVTRIITAAAGNSVFINGTLRTSNTSGLNLTANTTFKNTNATVITLGANSLIEYYSTSAQAVSSRTDYHDLTIMGASTKTISGVTDISGNVLINTGATLNYGTTTVSVTGNITGAGALTSGTTGTLNVGGNFTITTLTPSTGLIRFDGTLPQTIKSTTYGRVRFSDTGIKTLLGNITVGTGASITIDTISTLDAVTFIISPAASATILINGTLKTSNTAGFYASASTAINSTNNPTITLNGTSVIQYYNASSGQTITTAASLTYKNLKISGAATKTLGAALTIGISLTVDSGAVMDANTRIITAPAGLSVNINGTLRTSNTNGLEGSASATINSTSTPVVTLGPYSVIEYFSTSAHTITTRSYQGLTITGAAIKTAAGNISILGNLILNTGATFAFNATTVNLDGNLTGVGAVTATTGTLNIAGSFTNSGTFDDGTTSTIHYDGTGPQTVRATTYRNLSFSNEGEKTLAGAVTVVVLFTINDGAIVDAGTNLITAPAGTSVIINGELETSNTTGLYNASGATFRNTNSPVLSLGTNSVIEYYSTSAQPVTTRTDYQGLVITGNSTKTISGTVTVADSIRINANATLSYGTQTLTTLDITGPGTLTCGAAGILNISGNNTNTGPFNASTGTVNYTRSGAQIVKGASYNNLSISGSGEKAMADDASVAATLTLTAGSLAINGHQLTLAGTITGSGTISGSTESALIINGTGAAGTLNMTPTSASTKTLKSLTLNRTTSGSLTLGSSDSTLISEALTLTNGALSTNGKLVLLSTETKTARVGVITAANASISGTLTAQRFILGGAEKRKWRFLSSPVNVSGSIAFTQFKDDIPVSGVGGTSNGFDASFNNGPTIRKYNEALAGASSIGWVEAPKIDSTITTGKAVEVFVRGNRNLSDPFLLVTVPNNATIDYEGTLNTGNVTVNLSYTNNGNTDADGFNLVGNPYASQINWDTTGWTKTNIDDKFWSYNSNDGGHYGIYDVGLHSGTNDLTRYIASGQGFFVHATGSSPVLGFTEPVKAVGTPVNQYKGAVKSVPGILRLKLSSSDSLGSDETLIVFDDASTKNSGDRFDAAKFFNDRLNFYSKSANGNNLVINAQKYSVIKDTIPLSVFAYLGADVHLGNYVIGFNGMDSINPDYHIVLEDVFMNTYTDLRSFNSYSFDITADANSVGNNRFRLLLGDLGTGITTPVKTRNADILIYPNPSKDVLNIQLNKQAIDQTYTCIIFDQMGRIVKQQEVLFTNSLLNLDLLDLSRGVYTIQLKGKQDYFVKRFIKN